MDAKKCKRCGLKNKLSEEEINLAVERIVNSKGIRLVNEEVYNSRINVCLECEKIEYNSTCMACGCIMQVRARLADGRCPFKKWAK